MKILFSVFVVAIVLSGCKDNDNDLKTTVKNYDVVYLQTNDAGGNSILAYKHQDDTTLVLISGSPFSTGGTGTANPTQDAGTDASNGQLKITNDGQFLLATNSGSNTIAVFRILEQGALLAVEGSPFPSGGKNPVSIAQIGQNIFVANKAIGATSETTPPNYTSFTIDGNGALTATANSTFNTIPEASPSQIIPSLDGNFLFSTDFLAYQAVPASGTLRSFAVNGNGIFMPVSGTPLSIPANGGALGLATNPKANILYAGFPMGSQIGVYNINNSSGAITFNNSVASGAGASFLTTNNNGDFLYAVNSFENSVSVFNTTSPAMPVSIQTLLLKNSGPNYTVTQQSYTTSEAFSISYSPSAKFVYVISQYTNPDFTKGDFNLLHTLIVGSDGTLKEPGLPLKIPVGNNVRPQGLVTYTFSSL